MTQSRRRVALWLAGFGVSILAGASLAVGAGLFAVAAALVIVGFMVGLRSWRVSLIGLLVYLPFSGIVSLLTNSAGPGGPLIKDILFVGPIYLGFVASILRKESDSDWRLLPPVGIAVLLLLVGLGEMLNPSLLNPIVGLIGLRAWFWYIPLAVVGLSAIPNPESLHGAMALLAIPIAVALAVGLAEAVFIYSGHEQVVYNIYGPDLAYSVTQRFTETNFANGGFIKRIPGAFTFATQNYSFCAAASLFYWAGWRMAASRNARQRWLWLSGFVVAMVAALTAGSRGAIILIPALILLAALLDGGVRPRSLLPGLLIAGTAAAATAVLVPGLATVATDLTVHYVQEGLDLVSTAFGKYPLGLGPGMSTSAARHGVEVGQPFAIEAESWVAKAAIELGWLGAGIALAMMLSVVVSAFAGLRRAPPELRPLAAAIVAYILWNVVYLVKGPLIELDPGNVYFWLSLGLLIGLPRLGQHADY